MTATPNDGQDAARLTPVVYDELRRLAGKYFRRQPAGHTLQPTALVNEAYLRLARADDLAPEGRTHFLNVAAQAMRQVLTDHFRTRNAQKRGAGRVKLALDDADVSTPHPEVDGVDLIDSLERLSALSERQAKVVTLRFFGGLTVSEVATELDVSKRTVEQDWLMARAWLISEWKERE